MKKSEDKSIKLFGISVARVGLSIITKCGVKISRAERTIPIKKVFNNPKIHKLLKELINEINISEEEETIYYSPIKQEWFDFIKKKSLEHIKKYKKDKNLTLDYSKSGHNLTTKQITDTIKDMKNEGDNYMEMIKTSVFHCNGKRKFPLFLVSSKYSVSSELRKNDELRQELCERLWDVGNYGVHNDFKYFEDCPTYSEKLNKTNL